MEVKLEQPIEQKLLLRKNYKGSISFDGATPSRIEVKNKVAALLATKPELVIVSDILTVYGSNSANFVVRVYNTVEALNETEDKSKVKKNTPPKVEEEAKEETKAEPVAEVKAEEKKEETTEAVVEEVKEEAKE